MLSRLATAAAAASVLLVPAATAYAEGAAQVTDSRVNGSQLSLTVRVNGVPAGRSLDGNLTRVRVNGVPLPAQVRTTDSAAAPAGRAVVVVDASGSMGKDGIAAARVAAGAFARRVAHDVPVGLIRFSDRPDLLVAPTTDRLRLQAGLRLLKPQNGTALYDAVSMAVRTAGRDGSVVVLSDGADTTSRASLGNALSTVRASGVSVSTVAFRTPGALRSPLEQLAGAGGGRVVAADAAQSLADAFTRAAAAVPALQFVTVGLPDGTRQGSVEVTVSDRSSSWVARGSFPGVGSAGQLPTTMVRPGHWYTSLWTLVPVVFLAVLVLAWLAIPAPASVASRREQALAAYTMNGRRSADERGDADGAKAASTIVNLFERLLQARGSGARIAEGLDRAGSRLRPAEWLVIRACVCAGLVAGVTLLGGHILLGLVVGVIGGWLGTFAWLRLRQNRRTRAFADALPDTLQLVASSLKTGFSLPQALDAAQQDGVQPIAGELGRALAAARIGAPLEDELEEVARRMRNEDWRWAVMAIRIQRSVGGNLAEVLLTTVKTLRERAATRRQVRALSAEGLLSAYILVGLPIFVTMILLIFRREYLRPLWTSVPGVLMVAGSLVMLGVGALWMRKVVKVEV
ncbi:MAG TPA: type II secretion system F family protein [Actinomycetales bacterium]|nr:type II secretion system F family protein [Actinomycetales bacterium]